MKNLTTVQKTNNEINALAMEYKATKDDYIFTQLMEAVKDLAEGVAYKIYNNSKGLNVPVDEFLQYAYIAVFKATESYDADKGGNFTTHVKRYVEWTISDHIIKKSVKKSEQFYKKQLSLDMPVGDGDSTFMYAVEYQFATDADAVYDAVLERVECSASPDILSIAKELVSAFAQEASEDDVTIIKTTFATILSVKELKGDIKRVINKALEYVLGASSATVRQKKSRAFKRFETFASKKGYSVDLSQF